MSPNPNAPRDDDALDALLALSDVPDPSTALMGRVLADAPQPARPWWQMILPQTPAWAPAAALSVALLAGLGTGALVPAHTTDDSLEVAYAEEIDQMILNTGYDDWEGAVQ